MVRRGPTMLSKHPSGLCNTMLCCASPGQPADFDDIRMAGSAATVLDVSALLHWEPLCGQLTTTRFPYRTSSLAWSESRCQQVTLIRRPNMLTSPWDVSSVCKEPRRLPAVASQRVANCWLVVDLTLASGGRTNDLPWTVMLALRLSLHVARWCDTPHHPGELSHLNASN
ncbi:uncharacterized protein LOC126267130 [Schistocerca gregaria]|uniref:uncharacterized protein LOC126267130 n=1 Tax=Schistocerca gregaria TaxID=7010 RepID=UPI00211E939D|nr:uncharacterized protein LOC126267130 [Schistocerca gregaria]